MAEPAESRPSKKQRELLSFIDGFIAGHGYGPSYREIMRALNYKSVSTVAVHVDGLIAKGHLRKRDHSARSLEVVDVKSTQAVAAPVSKTQEKWLVSQVNQRFTDYEQKPTEKAYDELCILVGALSVLGLQDAATSAKARLGSLQRE
jgi:SOS-response transcriptional repressor LexA